MSTTSVFNNLDAELVSATGITLADNKRDLLDVNTPLLNRHNEVHGKGKPTKKGSTRWGHGMPIGRHSTGTAQNSGFETVNASVSGVVVPLAVEIAEIVYPVAISQREADDAGSEGAAFDLYGKRMTQAMGAARRDWEQNSFQRNVAGMDAFLSLNGDDTSTGLIENDGRGACTNTIGSFSRGTYLDVAGAQNDSYDFNGSANTYLLAGLGNIESNIRARGQVDLQTSFSLFSVDGLANYKRVVQTYERYIRSGNDKSAIDAVILELAVAGLPTPSTTFMPNAGSTTTADPWTYLRGDLASIMFHWGEGGRNGYFGLAGAQLVSGLQRVMVDLIVVRGQWLPESWHGWAVGYNGDAF
jgi:hypothetical protein